MLPQSTHHRRQNGSSQFVEDHFTLWEDAWFQQMTEERELDDLLDQLFPTE